jgi:hypothetical protein
MWTTALEHQFWSAALGRTETFATDRIRPEPAIDAAQLQPFGFWQRRPSFDRMATSLADAISPRI